MKIKKFIPIICIFCLACAIIFSSCSDKYTFNYEGEEIGSITIVTMSGGDNKENIMEAKDHNALIEDLNGLNYSSYSGDINKASIYQIVIKFTNGDEEIIDAFRIRRTDNIPLKYQCDDASFRDVVEKYINE